MIRFFHARRPKGEVSRLRDEKPSVFDPFFKFSGVGEAGAGFEVHPPKFTLSD